MVMTVARERSALKRSCSMNFTRPPTPACRALSSLCMSRCRSSSTPMARAPNFLAAAMTVRPSPEPRSSTMSFGPTFAIRSISSTTTPGVGTNGTSKLGCARAGPTDRAVTTNAAAARIPVLQPATDNAFNINGRTLYLASCTLNLVPVGCSPAAARHTHLLARRHVAQRVMARVP